MRTFILKIAAIILIAGGSAVFHSCTKDKSEPILNPEDMVHLSFEPARLSMSYDEDIETRKAIINTGNGFTYYTTYEFGFYFTKDAAGQTEYLPGYKNMQTSFYSGYGTSNYTWQFYLADGSKPSRVPLYINRGSVYLHGYYPYFAGTDYSDPKRIPFNVVSRPNTTSTSHISDYLYAEPIVLNPTVAGQLDQTVVFKHAMTCLSFAVTMVPSGSNTYLRKAHIKTVDGEAWLPISGYYDATDNGAFSDVVYSNEMELYFDATSSYDYTSVIMPEIVVDAAQTNRKLEITLYFGYGFTDMIPAYSGPLILDLAKLATANSTTNTERGLRKGYRYYYYITMNNYLKIENFYMPDGVIWAEEDITIKV